MSQAVVAQKRLVTSQKGLKGLRKAGPVAPEKIKKKKVVRAQRIVARENFEKSIKNKQEAETKLIVVLNKEYNKKQKNKFISHEFITAISRIYKVIRDKIDASDTFVFSEDADNIFRITMKNKTDAATLVGKISEHGEFHIYIQEYELKSADGIKFFLSFVEKSCGHAEEVEFTPEQWTMLYHATWVALMDDVCTHATFLIANFPELPVCNPLVLKQYMLEAL